MNCPRRTRGRDGRGPLRRRLRVLAVVVASAGATVLGACSDADAPSAARPLPAELLAGRDLYQANCSVCHGRSGGGGMGPALSNGRVVKRFPDVDAHVAVVRDGRGRMPAFEGILTPEEIDEVVRYEREGL